MLTPETAPSVAEQTTDNAATVCRDCRRPVDMTERCQFLRRGALIVAVRCSGCADRRAELAAQ